MKAQHPHAYKGLILYEPDTGLFRWLVRRQGTRGLGEVAGSLNVDGYIRMAFKTDVGLETWQAHRLAWLIMTGSHCETEIDHQNGIRHDNRWCNLRIATHSQNLWNPNNKLQRNNTSGFKGVSYHKNDKKWQASICVNGKRTYLGWFTHKSDAIAAREKAMRPHLF